jgi:hypothetical protein
MRKVQPLVTVALLLLLAAQPVAGSTVVYLEGHVLLAEDGHLMPVPNQEVHLEWECYTNGPRPEGEEEETWTDSAGRFQFRANRCITEGYYGLSLHPDREYSAAVALAPVPATTTVPARIAYDAQALADSEVELLPYHIFIVEEQPAEKSTRCYQPIPPQSW